VAKKASFVALFLLALLILSPWAARAQEQGPIYIVQPGDTLYSIAQRFGVEVAELVRVNGLQDPSLLQPGDRLIIPGFQGVSGILQTHELGFGETLAVAARRFGVGEGDLSRLNRVLNPEQLYVGQALIVATPEEGGELAGFRPHLVLPGRGPLAMAARLGQNPWSLAAKSGRPAGWVLPGDFIWLPSQEGFNPFPPPLEGVVIIPPRGVQGRTVEVQVRSGADVSVEGQLGDWVLVFHPHGQGRWVALQGIHAMQPPGFLELAVQITLPSGQILRFAQPMRVAEGGYPFDPVLYVPEETVDPANTAPEDAQIARIVSRQSEVRHWEGPFQFPAEYTESFPSRFGSRRNYNNMGYTAYHTGLDFYGGVGSPIYAPAAGKVVLAGELKVRGKVTFIDHGWGVYSGMLHQSEILVAEGQMVEAGQLIGHVGRTGRVTGPHLHWEVWVGGIPVDPLEWTERSFPAP
jgi:murein DD-endopeptidase MepM/ murein hydrolase activator NlpD